MTEQVEKLTPEDGKSLDIEAQNIEQLKQLFPDVFREGKVDFEALKAVLGEHVEDNEERYNFTWYGKNKARQIAQTPSTGTLRPCKEESINWDSTQNLFIEGDNLEVLKLLQKSYHQKVKMIYIDPPYNTGKDFVYKDNFQDNIQHYLDITNQADIEGIPFSANSDSLGRFHTNWLNMIYPRLKLARNLLRDDGVIFISIDDSECTNLNVICNEIFGSDNFIAKVVHKNNALKNQSKFIGVSTEYALVFAKNISVLKEQKDWKERKAGAKDVCSLIENCKKKGMSNQDTLELVKELYGRPKYSHLSRWNKIDDQGVFMDDNLSREGGYKSYTIVNPETGDECPIPPRGWAKSEEELLRLQKANLIWYGNGTTPPRVKSYLTPDLEAVPDNYKYFDTSKDKKLIDELLDGRVFEYPKPLDMIKNFIEISTTKGDVVLDFFAGSGTTGHAVQALNEEMGTDRKFICIQLPEATSKSSLAFKKGFKTIADISKARIRKVMENSSVELAASCNGFKVFKLDQTNINQWEGSFDNLADILDGSVDSIKTERTSEDVLYEVLLKYGLDLTYPITEHNLADKAVYDVAFGSLIVCLDDGITRQVVEGIGKLKQELDSETTRVVFKDAGFADDSVKVNAIQMLKQYGVDDVKSI